ncbi:MAG: 2-succinyl-5-enolpyruvyl-6-hydroxy-3-cyclohexene-1-carboxylic-acid synthase [Coleofasciculus sp. G1-WW12-02]|uniref:2-succinyl-5-enolpyruvyl-6-hydroxy-3- cyclohexene-1-carboxylic-acid synthase n=1 Tax=Coleofasciculus sp. G1-WW12-02 TaxID=3068483 RepID=UPI0032FAD374
MLIDFRNTNTVWASILVETLTRLGLTTAVLCPGSRSTPLTVAFAQHSQVEAIPILDERSAAFFALGLARKSGLPVALVCTSGTAGANFYPAIIEARESRVPLLILTADRPPELRDCHSGQTIDQVKLYGNYPNWQTELAVPSVEISMLRYLRQTVIHAWERSRFPVPGIVHLNCPFRDPLAPIRDPAVTPLKSQFQADDFFAAITPAPLHPCPPAPVHPIPYSDWQECDRGLIIAGLAQPQNPKAYCHAISQLSQALNFPLLAEGLSPLRNYAHLNPYLISTYDLILRNRQLAQQLTPTIVIQIGELPTSKELRTWLDHCQPQRWIIDPSHHNLDALHGKTTHLRIPIEEIGQWITTNKKKHQAVGVGLTDNVVGKTDNGTKPAPIEEQGKTGSQQNPYYLKKWCDAQTQVRAAVDHKMAEMPQLFEGKASWLLSQYLPAGTPLFIANSMPVRDVEFFWSPGNTEIQPWFNRGANGIDGTLSTALGIAHRNQSAVMLTGDLALLHDTNGFLLNKKFIGHLTIILINNNGGGIFEMLPISQFYPSLEEFFATPQSINFAQLCLTYGVEHQLIQSWQQLQQLLNPLPNQGIRVLELPTNRKADAIWRQKYLGQFAINPPT